MIAVTNRVPDNINHCALTWRERAPIDVGLARRQHEAYVRVLETAGLEALRLEINQDHPDSVFVEDAAVVVDELAVMTTMGVESRRGEVPAVAEVLSRFRPLAQVELPARLEGGDVLRVGRRVFVGLSKRTDRLGLEALAGFLAPLGYRVEGVALKRALHLKSAVTALDDETLIINREAIDPEPFGSFRLVDVPAEEPEAANVLRLPGKICLHAGFERTIEKLESLGYVAAPVDVSELLKAESGVTCSSIIV